MKHRSYSHLTHLLASGILPLSSSNLKSHFCFILMLAFFSLQVISIIKSFLPSMLHTSYTLFVFLFHFTHFYFFPSKVGACFPCMFSISLISLHFRITRRRAAFPKSLKTQGGKHLLLPSPEIFRVSVLIHPKVTWTWADLTSFKP